MRSQARTRSAGWRAAPGWAAWGRGRRRGWGRRRSRLPDADYTEVMTALAGDLAAMPWAAAWHVPSPRVFSAWRQAIGPGPLETVQEAVLRAACAEHQDHDYRAVQVGDLRAGAADGTLTRMP